ncbi:MAG: hypothetical protein QOE65_2684 [Solirubrobacteraceae bacterium]|jgi:hypothetical protein|nr:hypothetical protein [Solirubrobacteraceae bacterium]
MWALGHHLLLALGLSALAGAALRVASLAAPDGLERALAAAALTAAGAVVSALALGLVALGSSPAALTTAALVLWVAARRLPPPRVRALDELGEWWAGRSLAGRAAAGALTGLLVLYAAWLTRYPYLGVDGLSYHLPDVVAWVHDGRPGSQNEVLSLIPVQSYPLTHEVLLTWFVSISRSFTPIAPLQLALAAILAVSVRSGLGALRVPAPAAHLAAGALVTTPLLVGELNGPLTDLPTVAWLACTGALAAHATRRPALLGPALVAAGLAVGTRTTGAPGAAVALALSAWAVQRRHGLPARPLALGAAAAVAVGGVWYLRNLVQHGSPLWPLVAAPWGDPQPPFLQRFDVRFAEVPAATLRHHFDDYRRQLAGGLALMAGALAMPLLARRREALAATGVAVALVVAWTLAPYTGVASGPAFSQLAVSTIRYLAPAVLACAVAVALGARGGRRVAQIAAVAALGGALAWNVVEDVRAGFPYVPAVPRLAVALAGGAALGLAAAPLAAIPRLRAPAAVALALAAAAALSAGAGGYVKRHVDTGFDDAAMVAWLLDRPGFADGERPVAQTPNVDGILAGDRLRRGTPLLSPHEPCQRMRRRARDGWVVIATSPFPEYEALAERAVACFQGRAAPAHQSPGYLVYGPG